MSNVINSENTFLRRQQQNIYKKIISSTFSNTSIELLNLYTNSIIAIEKVDDQVIYSNVGKETILEITRVNNFKVRYLERGFYHVIIDSRIKFEFDTIINDEIHKQIQLAIQDDENNNRKNFLNLLTLLKQLNDVKENIYGN